MGFFQNFLCLFPNLPLLLLAFLASSRVRCCIRTIPHRTASRLIDPDHSPSLTPARTYSHPRIHAHSHYINSTWFSPPNLPTRRPLSFLGLSSVIIESIPVRVSHPTPTCLGHPLSHSASPNRNKAYGYKSALKSISFFALNLPLRYFSQPRSASRSAPGLSSSFI